MTDDARFAQLIYTSDLSGFGVKDTLGSWTDEETTAIRRHIAPSDGFGVAVPLTHSAGDPPLPKRMVWTEALPQVMGLWTSCPVQPDLSGRGTRGVFAHCLIDRGSTGDRGSTNRRAMRPIQWWGAPDLLTPFATVDYTIARLTGEPQLAVGEIVTRETVLEHLAARGELCRVLLDAIHAGMIGGDPVVLGVDTQDSAVQWVGLLSFLMSPGTAWGLRFSVLEVTGVDGENDTLKPALNRGLHLVCVPRAHFDALSVEAGRVLVDENASVEVGQLDGSPHRLSNGTEVEVTPWSVLVWSIFEWGSVEDLERLDGFAQQVGDEGLDPAVPCALQIAFDDAAPQPVRSAAARVLLERTPARLSAASEELQRAVARVVSWNLGSDPASLAAVLARVDPSSALCELVLRAYLDAVAEHAQALISARTPLSVPGSGRFTLSEGLVLRWLEVLDLRASMLGDLQAPVYILRALDHLWQLGRFAPGQRATLEAIHALVEGVLPADFPVADGLVGAIGPVSLGFLADVVRPVVSQHPMVLGNPVGSVPTPLVLQWLFVREPAPDLAPSLLSAAAWLQMIRTFGNATSQGQAYRLALLRSVTAAGLRRWTVPPSPAACAEAVALAVEPGDMFPELLRAMASVPPHLVPSSAAAAWRLSADSEADAAAADRVLRSALERGHAVDEALLVANLAQAPVAVGYDNPAAVDQLRRRLAAAATLSGTVGPRRFGRQMAARLQVALLRAVLLEGVWGKDIASLARARHLVQEVPVEPAAGRRELSLTLKERDSREFFAFDLLLGWCASFDDWPFSTLAAIEPTDLDARLTDGASFVEQVLRWQSDQLTDELLAAGVDELVLSKSRTSQVELDPKAIYKELRKRMRALNSQDSMFSRITGFRR